ncbi:anti-phage ZorAB system protein ZorA [Succinimonas amylolytica]|uniref:anti-phage ZorAB system protein ZorA n=1 Tax=Succinimonas amylolytica TaxID=83769 RepID=UPI0023A8E6A9
MKYEFLLPKEWCGLSRESSASEIFSASGLFSTSGIFCIIIVALLILFFYLLYKDTAKIEKNVSIFNKKLNAEKGNCNSIDNADRFLFELENQGAELKQLICLFRNSLVKRRPKNGQEGYCGGVIYCNKGQAEDVFNEYSLAKSLFSKRFFTPSALTGLGVLGTFVGLLQGLSGHGLTDLNTLNSSDLSPLIAGAGTAFVTSVWGITGSVLANLWIVILQSKTRSSIDALVSNVDLNFPPKTSSEFREYVIVEDESSSVQGCIRKLGQDLSEVFIKSNENLTSEIGREIGKYLKEMDDRAADVIAKTLDKLQDRLNEGIAEQIKSVDLASQRFVSSIREATNAVGAKYESIGGTIENYAHSLEESVQEWQGISCGFVSYVKQFSEAVEISQKTSLEDKARLVETAKTMQNMVSALKISQDNVKESMDAVTAVSQEIKGNVGVLHGIADVIRSGMDGIRDFEPKINSSLAESINKNNEYVEKWAQAYNQTIRLSIERLQSVVKDNTEFVSNWAVSYNNTITGSINDFKNAVNETIITQNEAVNDWRNAYHETIKFSIGELKKAIEKLAENG